MNQTVHLAKKAFPLLLFALAPCPTAAQPGWTVERCMAYAVAHNHEVRMATLQLDNYAASHRQAIGSFLPYVEANVGGQYNFGRAIDPETNTYTNVSTFYNGYSLFASIPVFDGLSRLHALRAAKADLLMGKSDAQQQRDQAALATYQAFVDVTYYHETVKLAEAKVAEQAQLLLAMQTMEEVGQKSHVEVAQMEAQKAEADYDLLLQRHHLEKALLTLKKTMNYPLDEELTTTPPPLRPCEDSAGEVAPPPFGDTQAADFLPALRKAHYARQSALHQWRQARADFFPTLSLSVGLSTTFYKTLHTPNTTSFAQQISNNMGEYVTATVSIPLFNRLRTLGNVRRAKNKYLMAQETYDHQREELRRQASEAALDLSNCRNEALQLEHKVKADSLAYIMVKRKLEEGLATATDLHTSATALLQSRVSLLQKRLMACLKQHLLDYYTGGASFTDPQAPDNKQTQWTEK